MCVIDKVKGPIHEAECRVPEPMPVLSWQVAEAINLAVGCHYFLSGTRYLPSR